MQRHDFAYELPPELIAQTPLAERSASRLLVLDPDAGGGDAAAPDMPRGDGESAPARLRRDDESAPDRLRGAGSGVSPASSACLSAKMRDCTMRDFPGLLRRGDLLVFNDTKVVAARLVGTKPSGGRVEIFLERVVTESEALAQLRASKPIREGLEVTTAGGVVRILGRQDDLWRVEFPGPALEFFEKWGDVPLPPYIHRAPDANDRERYQSIFARERGAVAAPTASLHFDSQLIGEIEARGVSRVFVTLHVGAGTFQPVRMDDLESHVMHAERVSVSAATCRAIEKTRAEGGRVIAVGTTVIRALESAALAATAGTPTAPTKALAAGPPAAVNTAPLPAASNAAAAQIVVPAAAERTVPAAAQIAVSVAAAHAAPATAAPPASEPAAPAVASTAARAQTPAPTATGAAAQTAAPIATAQTAPASSPHAPMNSRVLQLPAEGWSGETRLFIRPGFKFQVADALLTNFHLPESTLLMLVCAFAGMDPVLAAYKHAVRAKYRFFSYGDAMFLTNATTNAAVAATNATANATASNATNATNAAAAAAATAAATAADADADATMETTNPRTTG